MKKIEVIEILESIYRKHKYWESIIRIQLKSVIHETVNRPSIETLICYGKVVSIRINRIRSAENEGLFGKVATFVFIHVVRLRLNDDGPEKVYVKI